jgi:glycosyltransferase involved in cell wall biosynthesis
MIEQIREKTKVVYPGCRFETGVIDFKKKAVEKPLIIWNHRWDHDKNFETFFDVLSSLKENNILFSLALLGERFKKTPDIFRQAKAKFKSEIVVFDYVKSRDNYISWLKKGAIVVSSAIQENFGISVVEAVRYGCIPLLPDRLSYPELLPDDLHHKVLYKTKKDFEKKLEDMVVNYPAYLPVQKRLSRYMERFSWEIMVKQYDDVLQKMRKG